MERIKFEEIARRLKLARELNNKTLEEAGKIIGVHKSTILRWENGETEKMKIPTLQILAEYYGVNPSWLMGYDVPIHPQSFNSNAFPLSDRPIKVVILGKISAGLPILAVENIEGYEYAPSSFIKKGYEYFYLKVQGDSMNLKFPEGELVLVQRQDTLENNEIGVILVNGYDATVKKYRYENDLVILEPMSTNPEHTTQIYNPKKIDIKIIGKVILHIGKV